MCASVFTLPGTQCRLKVQWMPSNRVNQFASEMVHRWTHRQAEKYTTSISHLNSLSWFNYSNFFLSLPSFTRDVTSVCRYFWILSILRLSLVLEGIKFDSSFIYKRTGKRIICFRVLFSVIQLVSFLKIKT